MIIKKKFTSGSWTPGAHTVGKHNANCIIMDSVKVHLNLLDFWCNNQAHGICIANSGVLTHNILTKKSVKLSCNIANLNKKKFFNRLDPPVTIKWPSI